MASKKSKKGPQFVTVALLVAYPVLCGQAATSFALSHQQSLGALKTPQELLNQRQTKNFQGLGLQSAYQSPAFYSQTEEEYQNQVDKATQKLTSAKAILASATQKLNLATAHKASTKAALDKAQSTLTSAQTTLDAAHSKVEAAQSALTEAQAALDASDAELTQQTETLLAAQEALEAAQTNLTTATSNLTQAQASLASIQQAYQSAQTSQGNAYQTYQDAQSTTNAKLAILQTAQANYNSSQVPNPNYVAPSVTTVPVSYQIPDNNFTTGTPWIGDGTSPGQPQIHSGHLHYSYVGTEVYQDILLYPRQIGNYTFTVSVYNQDQNTVGYTGNTPDTYGLRIYFYDANNNLIDQGSVTSSEVHSWRDVTLQGNLSSTTNVAKVRIAVYGIDNGYWQGTYGPAMQNVRLQLGWVTGTTQAATTTGTMNVDINEGGEATFTAPNNGTFISSNLRYEAIDDATCGANVSPTLGGNTVTLAADNGVWGDTCGGWYKHLVGTLTYSTAEPQFIKDASLLPAITAAQLEYDNALTAEQQALTSYQNAQGQSSSTSSAISTSQQSLEDAQAEVTSAQSAKDSAQSSYEAAQSQKDATTSQNNTLKAAVASATAALSSATSAEETASTQVENIDSTISSATDSYEDATAKEEAAQDDVTSAQEDVNSAQDELDAIPAYVPPAPEEPVAPEIPKGDPKDLSTAEVAALVTQAEAVLESAEQGSPAYEQALEALAVAADADDPEISAELAAIPLLGDAAGAALEVLNNLGNVGADMAPAVREEAEKTVIASVIATGAAVNAVQAAAGAAASAASAAAASTTSSTSGSSGSGSGGGASSSSESKPTRSTRKAK